MKVAPFVYTYIYIHHKLALEKWIYIYMYMVKCCASWGSNMAPQQSTMICTWRKSSGNTTCAKGIKCRGATFDRVKCCASSVLPFHCMHDLAVSEESDPSQSWRFDLESNVAPFPPLYVYWWVLRQKNQSCALEQALGSQPLTWSKVALHQW